MNVVSLFDGIACGRVALEKAGISVEKYVAYEINSNAIKVAKTNYPDIEEKGDVFNAKYDVGEYDLLIGGSPCTYWSISNQHGGREVEASGLGWELFSQYVRALNEVKPKFFLYENNASMAPEIKRCISEALGCEPILIDSADFSAQHRKRLYWTNIQIDTNYEKSKLLFSDIMETSGDFKYRDFSKYAETIKLSKDGLTISYDTSGRGLYSQANRARKPNQKWNTLPASQNGSNTYNDVWVGGGYKARHLLAVEMERLQTLPDGYTQCLGSAVETMRTAGNGWTVDVIAHIFKGLKEE